MEENQSIDFWLLITALILAGVGLVMVYSSSMYLSMDELGDGMFFFKKHAIRLLIGLCVMMFLTKVNYRGYAKLGNFLLFAGVVLLVMLLVQKNSSRWLRLGAVTFQPSELMKVIVIIFMASAISQMGERVRNFRKGFLPLICILGVVFALVVVEPDLGTSGLILVIGFSILFLGRAKLIHLLLVTMPAAGIMALIAKTVPYMQKRIDLFLEKRLDFLLGRFCNPGLKFALFYFFCSHFV